MTPFRLFFLLVVLLALSACFDLNQSLTIKEDQTAQYELEMVMSAKLAGFSEMGGGDLCQDLDINAPPNMQVESKKSTSGADISCRYTINGPLQSFSELSVMKDGSSGLMIDALNDITYRVSSDFTSMNDEQDDSPANELAMGMMAAMFANRAIRWKINAPMVFDSNGNISSDGKTVSWSMPLATILTDASVDKTFYADIQVTENSFWQRIWLWIQSLWTSDADMDAKRQGFEDAASKVVAIEALEQKREFKKAEATKAKAKAKRELKKLQVKLDEAK